MDMKRFKIKYYGVVKSTGATWPMLLTLTLITIARVMYWGNFVDVKVLKIKGLLAIWLEAPTFTTWDPKEGVWEASSWL